VVILKKILNLFECGKEIKRVVTELPFPIRQKSVNLPWIPVSYRDSHSVTTPLLFFLKMKAQTFLVKICFYFFN